MSEHDDRRGAEVLSWGRCRGAFHADGSLRDIYVLDTSVADWERFLDFVRSSPWNWSYEADGVPKRLPEFARHLLAAIDTSHCLSVDLGSILVCCHFFCAEEIELDFLPTDVRAQEAMDLVLEFVRLLGRSLEQEVVVSEENRSDCVWFRYLPEPDTVVFEAIVDR